MAKGQDSPTRFVLQDLSRASPALSALVSHAALTDSPGCTQPTALELRCLILSSCCSRHLCAVGSSRNNSFDNINADAFDMSGLRMIIGEPLASYNFACSALYPARHTHRSLDFRRWSRHIRPDPINQCQKLASAALFPTFGNLISRHIF